MQNHFRITAKFSLYFTAFVFLAGLVAFAYLGAYNRWWGDDWCFNADLGTYGFLGAMKGYTFITHYASNRISLTFFSYFFQLMGVFGVQILTGLTILLWFLGIWWTLSNLNRFLKVLLPQTSLIIMAGAILYFTIYMAPNRFQSIYWRSAILPYTSPTVTTVFILALITARMASRHGWRAAPYLALPLAFITGTFSEPGNAYLASLLTILLVITLLARKQGKHWAERTLPVIAAGLVGIFLAMVVLFSAPTNQMRLDLGTYRLNEPIKVPFLALIFSFDFIRDSLRGLPLPHLILASVIGVLPFLTRAFQSRINRITGRQTAAAILGIMITIYLMIAAMEVPSIYVEGGPPAPRTLIFARFALTVGIGLIAWLIGLLISDQIDRPWTLILGILVLLLSSIYILRTTTMVISELPRFVERAAIWDKRDESIKNAKARGLTQVEVASIDGYYMGHTRDFKENPDFWVNACAADYYGIDSIVGTSP
jgi:hypothetical protein